jgi:hypothetical protein
MPSIIRATTTSGLQVAPDNSGSLQLQTNGTTTAVTIDTSQNTTLAGRLTTASSGIQFSDSSVQSSAASPFGLKNRIINGDMVISQRNGTSSVTAADGTFGVDRFKTAIVGSGVFTMQQSSVAPTGFVNSQLLTVTTADTSIASNDEYSYRHFVEGFNFADMMWGTANAQTVTLSFWVRSSVTGTYAVGLRNSDANRTYPATYTISAANTWEYKTITIAGNTTGTWLTNNGVGVGVIFSLGAGSNYQGTANSWNSANTFSTSSATQWISTNGATFYLTGVQLERNTTATPFEWIPYGLELMLCQRYYYQVLGEQAIYWEGYSGNVTYITWNGSHPVQMRASPTCALIGTYATSNCTSVSINTVSNLTINIQATGNGSAGARTYFHSNSNSGYSASIEL